MNAEQTRSKLLELWRQMDEAISCDRQFRAEARENSHEKLAAKIQRMSDGVINCDATLTKLTILAAQTYRLAVEWKERKGEVPGLLSLLESLNHPDACLESGKEQESIPSIANSILVMGDLSNILHSLGECSTQAARLMESASQEVRENILRIYAKVGDI